MGFIHVLEENNFYVFEKSLYLWKKEKQCDEAEFIIWIREVTWELLFCC